MSSHKSHSKLFLKLTRVEPVLQSAVHIFSKYFVHHSLHISLTVTLIYGRYKSTIAIIATAATYISHYTDRNWLLLHFTTHTPVSH
jgi:hypothetical protein